MNLDKLYSLRKDFAIIGLTGRIGSGCTEIATKLSDPDFANNIEIRPVSSSITALDQKLKICKKFLQFDSNWRPFKVINYKDVLLFHLLHDTCYNNDLNESIEEIFNVMCQTNEGQFEINKIYDRQTDKSLFEGLHAFFLTQKDVLEIQKNSFTCPTLKNCLYDKENTLEGLFDFYFSEYYESFCNDFHSILNTYDTTKRAKFTHKIACNLRASGSVKYSKRNPDNIYTIAETINRIIKSWRKRNGGSANDNARIVIDALKNSLELMYFKERYSGFYMVATNKYNESRSNHLTLTMKRNYAKTNKSEQDIEMFVSDLIKLDEMEHESKEFKKGKFEESDVANCIQKSDYHIFIDEKSNDKYLSLDEQLLKFVSLIDQPGIITPSATERTMQVAYNAKYNSGCISRQVGAVVTDAHYAIKSIGWNDVPAGQMPCNLRSIDELINETSSTIFSDYEKKGGGDKKFRDFVVETAERADLTTMNGKNCSFCFKSFQNALENKENQVHTRSLHAEENAMLQISKNGGMGLNKGFLFTTASPCELCSKKAFQLGILKIFYIDPYPGISQEHILKAGIDPSSNPEMVMFQGAVGRAFHKLYEPFMAYKDEIKLLTDFEPLPQSKTPSTDPSIKEKDKQ